MSLYQKHRPKTLKGVVGQKNAVAILNRFLERKKLPHCLLLTGPSGCGKTTVARILKRELGCGDQDFIEKNCADFRGVDDVREIRRHVGFVPITGGCRIWLIDECHKMTNDAQNALLKLLEDTPPKDYFFLATTDPQKLIKTIHTRSSEIKLSGLSDADLRTILQHIIEKEAFKVSEKVIDSIVEVAESSGRKAVVLLEQVALLDEEEEQLKAVSVTTWTKTTAVDLARELMFGRGDWKKVAALLRSLKDDDVEGIRYCVMGYARAILVGSETKEPNLGSCPKAFAVIDIFSEPFYSSKHPGLAAACWEVVSLGRK